MSERRARAKELIAGGILGSVLLAGCGIDSYLNDPSAVKCDGKRTKADLVKGGIATFIIHGTTEKDVATVKVRRNSDGASVSVAGEVTGPPQQTQEDGFTEPVQVVPGAELSTFGAGGAWIIDVRKDTVVIQGSCEGM